jgi:DNA helicase HerA-like ATPase
MLQFVGDNAAQFTTQYGNISPASIGAVQRNLLALESQGADKYFAEPALNLDDFLQTDTSGRGVVNILAADKLMQSPRVYATLLLWLLSELFERLPEVGDPPKPKLVFFFDEAHLLFGEIPPALLEKIEQVVRLIRSKGVGVFFVTQNPRDVPDNVLGQLGNRVQHALRAFTPRDQKAVQAAAETFRANPKIKTEQAIMELGVGEALISCLDENGQPQIVERAFIVPPRSQLGPITPQQRQQMMATSLVAGVYDKVVDRESAYEKLTQAHAQAASPPPELQSSGGGFWGRIFGGGGSAPAPAPAPTRAARAPVRQPDSMVTIMAKSAVRTVGSTLGREIIRGVLGGIFGGRRR